MTLLTNNVIPVFKTLNRSLSKVMRHSVRDFHFDVVQGCQLSCLGCPNSTLHPKIAHVTTEVFDQCLRNVDVQHVETLRLFNYGEPFLHPGLEELLPIIPAQKFRVDRIEISTNAMLFQEERLRSLLTSGVLTHLYVSCDGDGTPEDFERLRPPMTWEKLLRFLDGVGQLRAELNSPVQLATRSVCTSSEGQARWREVLEQRGWTPEFRPWQNLPNSAENPSGRPAAVRNGVCWSMSGVNLYVNYRGDVIPCCSYPDLPPMGNLLNQKFSEIHSGNCRKKVLHDLKTNRVEHPICGQCEA